MPTENHKLRKVLQPQVAGAPYDSWACACQNQAGDYCPELQKHWTSLGIKPAEAFFRSLRPIPSPVEIGLPHVD